MKGQRWALLVLGFALAANAAAQSPTYSSTSRKSPFDKPSSANPSARMNKPDQQLESLRAWAHDTRGQVPATGAAATVSAAQLNIPNKAKKELEEGNRLLTAGKLDAARQRFEQAIAICPQYADAYNNLGVLWMNRNELQKGREAFAMALELDRNHPTAALNLARIVYSEKDWPKAEDLLKRRLAADPQNPEALALLTVTELHLMNYVEVVSDARFLHALGDQNFAVVHLAAARALVADHQPAEAMVEYEMFLKEAPNSPAAPVARKELEALQGH